MRLKGYPNSGVTRGREQLPPGAEVGAHKSGFWCFFCSSGFLSQIEGASKENTASDDLSCSSRFLEGEMGAISMFRPRAPGTLATPLHTKVTRLLTCLNITCVDVIGISVIVFIGRQFDPSCIVC